MKRVILLVFILVSAGDLVAGLVGNSIVHHLCKPLIMISLGIYYWLCVEQEQRSTTVLLAIFFSLGGDTLLMYEQYNELYFILGLGSFLIAHIFYILAYRQHRSEESENPLQGVQQIRFAFPIVLAGTGLVVILYPTLGELKAPVMIYALVIVVMVLTALLRYGYTNSNSFALIFSGAILFMISDSLLAVNKFLTPISNAGVWIMITYCLAQYLIISGLIKHRS